MIFLNIQNNPTWSPGSRRRSSCRTSWHRSARRRGNTRRPSHRSCGRWPGASTPPLRSCRESPWWPESPRNYRQRWELNKKLLKIRIDNSHCLYVVHTNTYTLFFLVLIYAVFDQNFKFPKFIIKIFYILYPWTGNWINFVEKIANFPIFLIFPELKQFNF